ncbi:protein phosphatase 1 regulatory subunit 12C isoform X2 [Latimeria chalumnae]|uniref:protein phosphatase 1 regulatory subunit 12C isoform X2 n=1 Tax=Latimeria chalumnae TaxID=7897 RepID=UPI00313D490A
MAEGAAALAKEKRREQLRRWRGSCTDREAAEPHKRAAGSRRSVRFDSAAEFLAACASGDTEEAAGMLRRAADERAVIESSNADGISALHQACIDENMEVVKFLVEHGANVNQADNEGWTPLHVAASCGYMEIAEYLLKHGANIAAVNSDGDLPLDLVEDDSMEALLRTELARIGIDMDAAKRREEEVMLQDARQWLNRGKVEDVQHPKTGASALHVAAAKGYIEVIRLLLQAGCDSRVRDNDGWTPLHAAAHWGVEEACRLLAENFCDMNAVSNVGQTPFDVADEDIITLLEELQKKQDDLRSEKEAKQKPVIIDTSMDQQAPVLMKHKKSSVCRMSSKEKISVQDLSKERKTLDTISIGEDESSSSSGEESEKSNDLTRRPATNEASNINGMAGVHPATRTTPSGQQFTDSQSKASGKEDPSQPAWLSGLRKTGSFGALPDAKLGDEVANEGGIKRSASSPRLDNEEKVKEPRLARVPPTQIRRMFSISDSSTSKGTRNTDDDLQMKMDSVSSAPSPTSTSSNVTASTESRDRPQRQRSYQTPVRDEESESQRKARSRLMRQSRRSTQGVTLTDLKEAEKSLSRSGDSKAAEQNFREEEKKERQDENQVTDGTGRLRLPSTDGSSPPAAHTVNTALGRTQAEKDMELDSVTKEETSESDSKGYLSARDRRKLRKERRALEILQNAGEVDQNEDSEQLNSKPAYSISDRLNDMLPNRTGFYSHQRNHTSGRKEDYRKSYEELLTENEKLKEQLQETQLQLTQCKVELERTTQKQERFTDRPALLELERFERKALERKAAELQEELKVLGDLKADNQRLKDENAALIRVISKLSK